MISDSTSWLSLQFHPTRLKKVQGKKKRDAAVADALKAENDRLAEENAQSAPPPSLIDDDEVSGDLLKSKDDDVIF